MQLRLLKKFVIYGHDQYVWHKAGSSVFNLEILMSKHVMSNNINITWLLE